MENEKEKHTKKQCYSCKKMKTMEEFYFCKKSKDNRMGQCSECSKAKIKKWVSENREKFNEGQRRRDAANPEAKKSRQRRYAESHQDQIKMRQASFAQRNPERLKEIKRKSSIKNAEKRKQYYLENRDVLIKKSCESQRLHPEKIKERKARYRARKYKAEIRDFTNQQWIEIQERFDHRCAYCGKQNKGNLSQEHVTPLSKGGNHTLSNIVPSCRSCNSKKGTKGPLRPVQPLLLSVNFPSKGSLNVSSPGTPPHLSE